MPVERTLMRTIETKGTVSSDGRLSVAMPQDIAPGEHNLVIVIDEEPIEPLATEPPELMVFRIGSWPEDISLRREDLYDDRGR